MHTFTLLLCSALLQAPPPTANSATPAPAPSPSAAATPAPAPSATATRAEDGEHSGDVPYQIGMLLRCPVCQGMSIAESPSDTAQSMMREVRKMYAAGKTRQQIMSYFVARYGEFVLLEPTTHGINILVWILPPLAILIGLFLVWRRARLAGAGKPSDEPKAESSATTEDAYLRAIRQEVER